MTGLTSVPISTKSPVIAALPPPVGWKPIAVFTPSGPGGVELHAAFGDRIPARHCQLVDAAVGLSLDADDLVDLRGVEIDRRRRRGRSRRLHRRLALAQRIADRGREFLGIAVPADVHVEGRGRAAKNVVVDRRDLQAVGDRPWSSPG